MFEFVSFDETVCRACVNAYTTSTNSFEAAAYKIARSEECEDPHASWAASHVPGGATPQHTPHLTPTYMDNDSLLRSTQFSTQFIDPTMYRSHTLKPVRLVPCPPCHMSVEPPCTAPRNRRQAHKDPKEGHPYARPSTKLCKVHSVLQKNETPKSFWPCVIVPEVARAHERPL